MARIPRGARRWLALAVCLCIVLAAMHTRAQVLWQEEEQRLRVGLKIFPACLGALEDLEDKTAGQGTLEIRVVYLGSEAAARGAVSALEGVGRIRGIPLSVEAVSAQSLDAQDTGPLAGIFVAGVDVGGARLRFWSEHHRTLVFSPFIGDVELGAVAGIHVADRILPFVNLPQAARAKVRFKPFFLQVARRHESPR
jgi:hypothetical protein